MIQACHSETCPVIGAFIGRKHPKLADLLHKVIAPVCMHRAEGAGADSFPRPVCRLSYEMDPVPHSLDEIARAVGLSKTYVYELEQKALNKLARILKGHIRDLDDKD